MTKRSNLMSIAVVVLLCLTAVFPMVGSALAAEKIKVATPIKNSPLFFLPPMVAMEKGFWQEAGVEAEWFPFIAGRYMTDAVVAGAVDLAITTAAAIVQNAAAGITTTVVAHLEGWQHWYVWVRADSRIKSPQDIKGAKIGFSRFRSLTDAYSVLVARKLGLEREVKYTAVGGVPQMIAALKAGTVDAIVLTPFELLKLELAGEIRRLVDMDPYFPKRWMELTFAATKRFIDKNPDLLNRVLKGILRANEFIMKNPDWSIERIKKERGDADPVARGIYKMLQYSSVGSIDVEGLRNVRNFMIEFKLVDKEKTPPIPELYTDRFVPVRH